MSALHIGFTGTRDATKISGERKFELFELLKGYVHVRDVVLHHGACVGMDELAHDCALENGCHVVVYPPSDPKHQMDMVEHGSVTVMQPKPYLERDRDIVDNSTILIAVPKDPEKEVLRSGTWATIRYARKLDRPITII